MPNRFRGQRGRVAALARHRDPADPELLDARRCMREEAFLDTVATALSKVPALNAELRHRAIRLLSGSDRSNR